MLSKHDLGAVLGFGGFSPKSQFCRLGLEASSRIFPPIQLTYFLHLGVDAGFPGSTASVAPTGNGNSGFARASLTKLNSLTDVQNVNPRWLH